jgi:hypothetical protein
MYIIELLGTGRRTFVESYSNTRACPRTTSAAGQAKPFSTEKEARDWADSYLPGYKIQIVPEKEV